MFYLSSPAQPGKYSNPWIPHIFHEIQLKESSAVLVYCSQIELMLISMSIKRQLHPDCSCFNPRAAHLCCSCIGEGGKQFHFQVYKRRKWWCEKSHVICLNISLGHDSYRLYPAHSLANLPTRLVEYETLPHSFIRSLHDAISIPHTTIALSLIRRAA